MTIDEFRAELGALLEKVRTDTVLGKRGREIVINLLAAAVVIAHRSGGQRAEVLKLWQFLVEREFDPRPCTCGAASLTSMMHDNGCPLASE